MFFGCSFRFGVWKSREVKNMFLFAPFFGPSFRGGACKGRGLGKRFLLAKNRFLHVDLSMFAFTWVDSSTR
jgi:hypothetical protein